MNIGPVPELVFEQSGDRRLILHADSYLLLLERARL
jgi:hypothetical protein